MRPHEPDSPHAEPGFSAYKKLPDPVPIPGSIAAADGSGHPPQRTVEHTHAPPENNAAGIIPKENPRQQCHFHPADQLFEVMIFRIRRSVSFMPSRPISVRLRID